MSMLAAMEELYRRVDARVASQGAVCWLRGQCCRFGSYGHRLYVTRAELVYFLARQRQEGLRPVSGEACPYQRGSVCTARGHRPLGCRIFFCDPVAQEWQNPMYEEVHKELKQIGERFGVPYEYKEWLSALRDSQQQIPDVVEQNR